MEQVLKEWEGEEGNVADKPLDFETAHLAFLA